MRKRITVVLLCCLFGLTACQSKEKEEALAQTTEVVSKIGEVRFTLNGYWSVKPEEELIQLSHQSGQIYDLYAHHTQTGSSIQIVYEDLNQWEGGTLVRIKDYVSMVRDCLPNELSFPCECGEVTTTTFEGKEYWTFPVTVEKLSQVQHFYIRRIDDTIMIMIITLQGDDTLESVPELATIP